MTTYTGTGAGPCGIAFDGTNMWTGNYSNNSVTKISPTGAMTTYTGTGANPCNIAFDGTNMWTANPSDNTVTKVVAVLPTGTVSVYSNISSSWSITGPAAITGSGTSQTSVSQPTGTYTITWGAIAGYTTPASQSFTLTSGGTISFSGTYSLNSYTVSATAGAGGTISPASRVVTYGNTTTFTVTPNAGYTASASGCGGSLSGTTYTTGAITGACTVSATYTASIATPTAYISAPSTDTSVSQNTAVAFSGSGTPIPSTSIPATLTSVNVGSVQNYANMAGPSVIPSLCQSGGYSSGYLVAIQYTPGQIDSLFHFTYQCTNDTYSCPADYTLSGTNCIFQPLIISYEWREGNCTTGTLLSSASSFNLSTPTQGTRTIYLRVKDSQGTWSTNCPSRVITITSSTPTSPTISGPSTLVTGQSGTYSFVSTDPQVEQISYAVDWNSDGTDLWMPYGSVPPPGSMTYVNSGVSQSASKSWATPGTYTVRVLAQDTWGNNSAWTTYTITVSDPQPCTAGVVDSSGSWAPTCATSATCLTPPDPSQLTNQPGIQIGLCPTPEYTGTAYRACSTATITCTPATSCGDNTCNGSETILTCPADCKGRYQQF